MSRKLRNTAFMWHNLIVGRLTIRKTCVLRIVPSSKIIILQPRTPWQAVFNSSMYFR